MQTRSHTKQSALYDSAPFNVPFLVSAALVSKATKLRVVLREAARSLERY